MLVLLLLPLLPQKHKHPVTNKNSMEKSRETDVGIGEIRKMIDSIHQLFEIALK